MTLKRWTVAAAPPVLLPPCAAHAAHRSEFHCRDRAEPGGALHCNAGHRDRDSGSQFLQRLRAGCVFRGNAEPGGITRTEAVLDAQSSADAQRSAQRLSNGHTPRRIACRLHPRDGLFRFLSERYPCPPSGARQTSIGAILDAAVAHKAHAVGMSGLLVKSTVAMRENLEEMSRHALRLPVMLRGAALTRRYVEEDCVKAYAAALPTPSHGGRSMSKRSACASPS